MMRGPHNVVCISSIDWDFIWQGHQEVMARLAAQGHRVLFIENTGVRPIGIRDLSRVRSRIRNWWRGTKGFREERPGLFVLSPLLVPLPYSRVALWANRSLLRRALRRWMRAVNFHNPIVWTFLPTPLARAIMRDLDPAVTIYYCIDDLASSSRAARKIVTAERQIFKEADLVFVTSEKLRERAARYTDRVHVFPFAVNYEAFERVRVAQDGVPPDLKALPRPVIGYVGGLHQWVDQPLIGTVADAFPDASIVLVGPKQVDVSELERHANIHFLGARPHAQLPGYIKGFDAALIPYALSEYTTHVYPTKLNEYLAMGVPVVATDLVEIRRFAAKYGNVVEAATSPDLFVDGVRRALVPASAGDVQRRTDVARDNGWTARLTEMSGLVAAVLEGRSRTPVGWEAALGRLYRRAQRPILFVASTLLALYVLVFHTSLVWVAAEPLRVVDSPRPADVIVVLAGGIGESGLAGEEYQEKVLRGVDLYRAGYAGHMILSSGATYVFREAQVMRALAIELGVPQEAIVLDEQGGGNYASLLNARAIMQMRGWNRALVVTSPYNTVRSRLVIDRNLPDAVVRITPPIRSVYFGNRGEVALKHVRAIAHEYVAILYYWWKGYI